MPVEFIQGDVIAIAQGIEVQADFVFADPPYDLGVDYGSGPNADRLGMQAYVAFSRDWIKAYADLLNPGGTMMVLVHEKHADAIGAAMTDLVGPRRARVIWNETFSQYNPHTFGNAHRHLFYHVKPGAKHLWNPDPIRVPSKRMEMGDKRAAGPRVPSDVWTISRLCGTFNERVEWHPAQLPSKFLERCMLPVTQPGLLVVEPFSGSGSLAVLCQKYGRNYIGIDSNPEYVTKSRDRMATLGVAA